MRTSRTLVFTCVVEESAVRSGTDVDVFGCSAKGLFKKQGNDNPKECWCEDAALLDTAAYVERLGSAAVKLYYPLYVVMEGLYQTAVLVDNRSSREPENVRPC